MVALNEPAGCDGTAVEDDWTPAKGLLHGAAAGGLLALILIMGLWPVVVWLPYLFLVALARAGVAFAVTWLLLRVVSHAAGMTGWPCAAIALALASHHVVFALHGVPALGGAIDSWWLFPTQLVEPIVGESDGLASGWRWFHPYVLVAVNALPLTVALALCAYHDRD
jgi:hypothetical protein